MRPKPADASLPTRREDVGWPYLLHPRVGEEILDHLGPVYTEQEHPSSIASKLWDFGRNSFAGVAPAIPRRREEYGTL